MKVKDLIEFLKTQPQDLTVIYALHSEYKMLELYEIEVIKLQKSRTDGWVHNDWGNKILATTEYLAFPGN